MLHIAAYPACMQGELELLLPAERTAVDALVDKWSQTTGEMYLTRFMRVCESEWDLLAAGAEHCAQLMSTAVAIYYDDRLRHTVWDTTGDHDF